MPRPGCRAGAQRRGHAAANRPLYIPLTIGRAWKRHSWFGGLLIQRDPGPRLTLGGEVFRQNAQAVGSRGCTLLNLGSYYHFDPDFSLLFSAGRSSAGAVHTVAYLGLYGTWASRG